MLADTSDRDIMIIIGVIWHNIHRYQKVLCMTP